MKKRGVLLAAAIAAVALAISLPAKADSVTPFDDATGTGPWGITSQAGPPITDGGVNVSFSTPFAFNTLATLSATFTDNLGGADGGGPRFVVQTNGGNFAVYLGTPPSFNDSSPSAFTTAFSGLNLNNGTSDSAIGNSGSYVTLASLEATFGGDLVTNIFFVTDGGWAANGTQDITLDSIDVNGTSYSTSATPLPATLPLFAGGLGLVGFLTRRKKKTTSAPALA